VEKILEKPLTLGLIASDSGIFPQEWMNYLFFIALNSEGEPGLLPNTVGKQNKNIKAFLNWCFDKNVVSRFSLKPFVTVMEDEITFYREVAGESIMVKKKKYEEVTSYTCRRTFCTLKFLKGMPAQAIMKFSGHKTERNFLKYLKLDAELTARKYGEYFYGRA
jgi:hypothetical protein